MLHDLEPLTQAIDDNIGKILNEFNVKLNKYHWYYNGKCPIHCGDNPSSFCLFHNENQNYKSARWKCYTKGCESIFCQSSIGLVRGLLSREKYGWNGLGDRIESFSNTLQWCRKFVGFKEDVQKEKVGVKEKEFELPAPQVLFTKQEVRDSIIIPSPYFLNRGFSPDTLDFFDVGRPKEPVNKFFFREFVPVYDFQNEFCIGAVCRTVFDKCEKCNVYHDKNYPCPKEEWRGAYCKWKNYCFRKEYSLYNLWNASESIKRTGNVVLGEGSGTIWKLNDSGIRNCVSAYGVELCYNQAIILERFGVKNICVAFDNDKAGEEGFLRLGRKYWQRFNIHKIEIPPFFNDLGEMEPGEIDFSIKPQVEKWNRK